MQFGVYVTAGQRKELAAVMAVEKARIKRWKQPRQSRIAKIEKPADRTIARGKLKRDFNAAVRAGKFITSRDVLIEDAVVAELDERGWFGVVDDDGVIHPYPEVPEEFRGPGRRYGSTDVEQRYRVGDPFPGGSTTRRIGLVLSDEVGQRLARACYHEHKHLVAQLEAFYGVFGDSPLLPDPRPGEQPDELAKRYRDELRAQITTTGDILRAAVDRVIANRRSTADPHPRHDAAP
jgi:hypothetical protein